jgi:tetratricopeptide (TPR) repeat protein
MQTLPTKEIFISYAEKDKPHAIRLREVIQDYFGPTAWMREYDLNGGDLVADALDNAMSNAKWWVIFVSEAALKCTWITKEARIGTFRSLEDEGFKVIIVKLESCEYPKNLEILLKTQYTVELNNAQDIEEVFMVIADYIEKFDTTRPKQRIYEDRGSDTDKFSLITRRNKIGFVLGWRGIGKTAFVENSIEALLGKRAVKVTLSYEHSLDRLCRDVIKIIHKPQPVGNISNQELLNLAIRGLTERQERFFLFLDDAEFGLDGSNRILPYLMTFLQEFLRANINTHIVIATSRNPDYSEEIASEVDVFRLGIIDDQYIQEIIYKWLDGTEQLDRFRASEENRLKIIKAVGGHPLAAKRMSTFLKIKPIEQLIDATRRERFQLGFADYILRATQDALSDIHILLLRILATIQEPLALTDLAEISSLSKNYSQTEIDSAIWELSDWFLIEHRGERIFLHDFLATYYSLQLKKEKELRDSISSDFGDFAYRRVIELNEQLTRHLADSREDEFLAKISNELYRYAVPADRLLRSVGKEDLAEKLPIRNQGTLRGMVYYFYQTAGDYKRSLEYAEKWLSINPEDSEIRLYQIRSYRNLGGKAKIEKAWDLIKKINAKDHKKQFQIRILREKAILSAIDGDEESSEGFYRQAIQMDKDSYQPYSELYAGLARLLLRKADALPEWEPKHQELASEALELLEVAKKEADNFYRFHLDVYAEALAQTNNYDIAHPLLEEALQYRPEDGKLNFRMAEFQRRKKNFEEAKRYADISSKNGYNPSLLTYANILYDEAIDLSDKNKRKEADKLLSEALAKVDSYIRTENRSGHNIEVAHTITAKIHRCRGEYDKADEALRQYKNSHNPYTVYEQANLCLIQANRSKTLPDALSSIQEGIGIIQEYKFKLSPPLEELRMALLVRQKQVRNQLGLE